MKEKIVALVDCDSFFVSCEQSLDSSLKGKPVCVLSNNGGCVVARSLEAKQMGVRMGMPYFMAKKEFPRAIYIQGDLSKYKEISEKIMNILKEVSPFVEIYSIDEAFLDFSGLKKLNKCNYYHIAKRLRERVMEEVGVSISIGLSKSKVLAKLASENAKPGVGNGIFIIGKSKIPKILKNTKVNEIWGIGRKTTLLFNQEGILTCDKLVEKSDSWLKSKIGIRGLELRHELLGECVDCVKMSRNLPKSIQNTRSFPKFSQDLDYIKNELNIHIHTSCSKLRKLNGKCQKIGVYLKTKDFYSNYERKVLEDYTTFELEISREAMKLLEKMYHPNILYRSCGITLEEINYNKESQLNLFQPEKTKDFSKLAKAIDKLESRFGKDVIKTGFVKESKTKD